MVGYLVTLAAVIDNNSQAWLHIREPQLWRSFFILAEQVHSAWGVSGLQALVELQQYWGVAAASQAHAILMGSLHALFRDSLSLWYI